MAMSVSDPEELVSVLGRKHSLAVLAALDDATTVQELSDEIDVPVATAYRRIEELQDCGLVEHVEDRLTEDRNRAEAYRRSIDELTIGFENDTVSVTVEDRSTLERTLDETWGSLPDKG